MTHSRVSLAIDRMNGETHGALFAERMQRVHLSDVALLEQLCFAEPWSETSLSLLLTDAAVGFVVCDGTRAVAYAGMMCVAGEGQITNVAVHPDCRRQGLGRTVVSALLQYAQEHDFFEISLEVRASNRAAITLYEALGFSVGGTRHNFYQKPTEDAYVMLWHNESA